MNLYRTYINSNTHQPTTTTTNMHMTTPKKEPKTNKKKVCLYFDKDIYKDFQDICERRDAPVSRVLSRMMNSQINAI
jgi:hypothetical protein